MEQVSREGKAVAMWYAGAMADELSEALTLESNPSVFALRSPLAAVLRPVLPPAGVVLEIGSGNGELAVYLAGCFPRLTWQPSDPDPARRAAIERWRVTTSAVNVERPLALDVTSKQWPVAHADAALCCGVLHAAPVEAVAGLMKGAARLLPLGAPLVVCGMFATGADQPVVAEFDRRLRAHDPAWGVRDLDVVLDAARAHGLRVEDVREMPLSRLALVLVRGPRT